MTNQFFKKYQNVHLGISETGKPLLYSPDMPAVSRLKQSYPLRSPVAVKAIQRDYRGENRLQVNTLLNQILKSN